MIIHNIKNVSCNIQNYLSVLLIKVIQYQENKQNYKPKFQKIQGI